MEISKGKKIAISIWLGITTTITIIFIAICIFAAVNKKSNKPQSANAQIDEFSEVYQYERVNTVSYDDVNHEIVLSVSELNYTYENLMNLQIDETYEGNDYLSYCVLSYMEHDFNFNGANALETDYIFEDTIDLTQKIYFSSDEQFSAPINKFSYYVDGVITLWEYELTISINNSDVYQAIKSAIELDIQNNQQDINESIFSTLSNSTVGFIGSISSGITAMISVFYSNNALTVIGTLAVIVVSITLAYFLFRLIFGLIRMRG